MDKEPIGMKKIIHLTNFIAFIVYDIIKMVANQE
jgi:hypothetical protein